MATDPVTIMNFVFAVIIFFLGLWVYYKFKEIILALYVAIGFLFFAISHLAVLLGVNSNNIIIIIIRAIAYLIIIAGLIVAYWQKTKSMSKKPIEKPAAE